MLLQQAGMPHPAFTLLVGNSSVEQQAGEVLQSMADEAGFDVKLQAAEANAQVAAARAGDYDATVVIWSGRPDPDGNVSIWLQCDGFLNWGKYCNPAFDDAAGEGARRHRRGGAPGGVSPGRGHCTCTIGRTSCCGMLKWLWALSDKVTGFVPTPDGLIRPQGMRVAP